MYRDHSVGVVVPAYNEVGFVGEVVETLPAYVDRAYVIDDCSTDGTWAEIQRAAGIDPDASADAATERAADVARPESYDVAAAAGLEPAVDGAAAGADDERAARDPTDAQGDVEAGTDGAAPTRSDGGAAVASGATDVVPIRHEENRGVGGAIKTGYRRAREDEMDVTVVVGGDGQMDPDYMDRLLDPIVEGRADYAKGNRLLVDEHHAEMPFHRVVGNEILTTLTKIATGYWQVGDPQMGYTAISLSALEDAAIEDMYEYFGYCNDLLVRLSTAGCRVADVPCPLGYGDEQSHITYSEYIPRVSLMLLGSFLRRLWTDRDSATGLARLGLFVGGAAAVGLGLLGSVVGALRGDDTDSSSTVLGGAAALLLAMLLDASTNAPDNYTERVPEDD